jgi:hypothetical protein
MIRRARVLWKSAANGLAAPPRAHSSESSDGEGKEDERGGDWHLLHLLHVEAEQVGRERVVDRTVGVDHDPVEAAQVLDADECRRGELGDVATVAVTRGVWQPSRLATSPA